MAPIPEEEELEESLVAVADTRPAVVPFLGLTYEFALMLLMGVGLDIVITKNPFNEWLMIVAWFVAREIQRYDYNISRIIGLWLKSSSRAFDAHIWGGATLAPFPVVPQHPRGIFDA